MCPGYISQSEGRNLFEVPIISPISFVQIKYIWGFFGLSDDLLKGTELVHILQKLK